MLPNYATLFGQIIGVLIIAMALYLFALIPLSLKKIAQELTEIKNEIRKKSNTKAPDKGP